MKLHIKNFFNGVIIGASMFVPGVSGGTTALLIGIYDDLIHSVSNLFKDFKNNIKFLLPFCLGGIVGIVLIASLISILIENFRVPMMFLFLGTVIGGMPLLFKKTGIKKLKIVDTILILIGFFIIYSLRFLPENIFVFENDLSMNSIFLFLIAGIIISTAFILPGLSTSHMLLTLGLYESTTNAIKNIDVQFLFPLGLSILLGIVLTIKLLDYCLQKYTKVVYLLIIGFILGSLGEIFPGFPKNMNILYSIVTFPLGFFAIYFMTRKEESIEKSS